jgi:hypothetical protein
MWVCNTCGQIISCRADDCRACGTPRSQREQIITVQEVSEAAWDYGTSLASARGNTRDAEAVT